MQAKVKAIFEKLNRKKIYFENIQKIEHELSKNEDFARELSEKCNLTMDAVELVKEMRMVYYVKVISFYQNILDNAVIEVQDDIGW